MVGGGPAGSAAAIVLASSGARVALLERSGYDGVRIGETLPPDVRAPLERLGVWDRFRDGGHIPSPGMVTAWGQPEPYANDFILNPYGWGWRVDRNRFDSMLAAAAREAGATVMTRAVAGRCVRAAPDGGWTVSVSVAGDGAPSELAASFAVDATGRTSSFCRFLGGRHIVHDRLLAVVGFVPRPGPDERALIEATEDGWWYSAGLPDGRLVLAFHTDPAPGLGSRWTEHLAAAPHTRARAGSMVAEDIRTVSANSHRMDPVAADGWLSVGDAATAHDPITGLGIHWALESGIAGAEAIVRSSTQAYGRDKEEHFDRYLATRCLYYRAEKRWLHSRFWQRRQEVFPPSERAGSSRRDPGDVGRRGTGTGDGEGQ